MANLSVYALSRGQESKEWFLNPQLVNRIFRKMGRAEVDLFTLRESAHLPVYFSIDRKDRRTAGTNALVQRWKFKKKYAFPPPQLIPLILAKMRETSMTQNKYAWRLWSDRYDVSKPRPTAWSFTKYLWFLFRERNLSLAALKVH